MSLAFPHGPAQQSPIITLAKQKKDNKTKQSINHEEEGRGEDLRGKIKSVGLNSIYYLISYHYPQTLLKGNCPQLIGPTESKWKPVLPTQDYTGEKHLI